MEDLAVRISKTESQIALLATKRELLRARQLTSEGEQLLAQVDALMSGNAHTITAYPVRTLEELIAAQPAHTTVGLSSQKVDEFLSRIPLDEISVIDDPSIDMPRMETPQGQCLRIAPGQQSQPSSKRDQKPRKTIFQQS